MSRVAMSRGRVVAHKSAESLSWNSDFLSNIALVSGWIHMSFTTMESLIIQLPFTVFEAPSIILTTFIQT